MNTQTVIGCKLRGADITLGSLAEALGWHRNVLDGYFPANRNTQPKKLPMGALWDILECDDFPNDLKALLAPDGFAVVGLAKEPDFDELARRCHKFLGRKVEAHDPKSPAGRELSPEETAELIVLSEELKGAA